jgi:hypothetical protein
MIRMTQETVSLEETTEPQITLTNAEFLFWVFISVTHRCLRKSLLPRVTQSVLLAVAGGYTYDELPTSRGGSTRYREVVLTV